MLIMCFRHTSDNVVELSEVSLDFNLHDSHLRICFSDAPVISGVSFFETADHVVILVCTASSAHRLLFKHPQTHYGQVSWMINGQSVVFFCLFVNMNSAPLVSRTTDYALAKYVFYTVYQILRWILHIHRRIFQSYKKP